MLNSISLAEAAPIEPVPIEAVRVVAAPIMTGVDARAGAYQGTVLPEGVGANAASGTGVVYSTRPRAVWGADVFGNGRMTTCQIQPLGQQCPSKQYPHLTRITAASGGGSGPHPARDPV